VNRPVTTADTAAPAERLIRKSEFARLVGVSHPAISKACRDGRLTPALRVAPDGREVLAYGHARRLWAQCHREPLPQVLPELPGLSPLPELPELAAAIAEGLPPLHESRARRAHYEATLEGMRVEAMRAALIPAAEVRASAIAEAARARAVLMELPDLLAPQLAACNDPRQCHRLMSETFRTTLMRLAGAA
jgi:hypothetical protein